MILERLVARIEGQSGQFDRTMSNIEGRQRAMTQRTSGMWRMFGMAAAAAVIAASVAVTSMAVQFDQSMRQVWTLVDVTEAEFQSLKEGVLDVHAAIGESQTVTSRALYQAVSGGVALGEALEFVETAGRAAIAGATDIFSMTSLLVGITNAYAGSQITAEHASDVLFTTIKYGVTTAEELGGSLGRVLGIASAAGIAFEDLAAGVATATKFMGQTDLVVTGLRALIMGILTPTDKVAAAAEKLGLNWSAAALRAYGLQGMLVKLIEATGGNAEAIAKIVPEARALAVAAGFTAENLEDYATYMAEAAEKTGQTTEALKKMTGAWQRWKRIFAGAKKDLISGAEGFVGLADGISKALLKMQAFEQVRETALAGRLAEALPKIIERYVDEGTMELEELQRRIEGMQRGLRGFWGDPAVKAGRIELIALEEQYAAAITDIEERITKAKEEEAREHSELYKQEEKDRVDAAFAAKLELKASAKEYLAYMEGAFRDESEALQDELDRRVTMHKKYAQGIERLQEKLRADQLGGAELLFRLELDHEQSTLEKIGMLRARAGEMESKANKALLEGEFKDAREYADKRLRLLEEIARKVMTEGKAATGMGFAAPLAEIEAKRTKALQERDFAGAKEYANKRKQLLAQIAREAITEGEAVTGMTFEAAKAAVEQGIAFQRQMTESSIRHFETLAAGALTSIEQLEAKLHNLFAAARAELVINLDASAGIENIEELTNALQQAIDRVAELDRKLGQAQKKRAAPEEAFQHGGWVGGTGGVDRIPALLTAGEFVVQPRAAARHAQLLDAMNRGIVTPGQGAAVAAGNTYTTGPIELHFHNPVTREAVRDVVIPELEAAARRGLLTPTLGGRG